MKKSVLIFLTVVILCLTFVFVACNAGKTNRYEPSLDYSENSDPYEKLEAESENVNSGTQERKIIYTANASISVDNVEEAVKSIRALLVEGEWVENSDTYEYSSKLVLRISSSRLESFMEKLSEIGDVNGTQISSNDVSLSYYDTTLRKQTLENEYSRLNELLKSAETMSDILTINKRLTEIEAELQRLQNTLNKYDSLIEYSQVTINVYKNGEQPKPTTFGDKVSDAYGVSGKILEGFGVFLIAILPYIAFAALLAVLIIVINKQVKKKKQAKQKGNNSKEEKNDNNVIPLNEKSDDNK